MEFSEKLRLLTHVFKISNSKLAKAINVDPSLISRWKTGDRVIAAQSPHLAALADFFIRTNAYPYQKAYLSRILQTLSGYRQEHSLEDTERVHLLANWLASADGLNFPPMPDLSPDMGDPVKLLDNISNWFSQSGQPATQKRTEFFVQNPTVCAAWHKSAVSGSQQQLEIFRGINGKRQAVVNLLLDVITSQKPCTLMLVSEESMNWLTDDPQFMRYSASLLRQVIEHGHRIKIIHIVSRRTQEITGILEYWFPLHLSGQIDSYYQPQYADPMIQQTLIIVKDHFICFSQATEEQKDQGLSFLCNSPEIIHHYTRLFESCLNQCQPLLNVYTAKKRPAFQSDLRRLQDQFERLYTIRHQLNPLLMPTQLFTRLLQACSQSDVLGKEHSAEWLLASRERFIRAIEQGSDVYELLSLSALEDGDQDRFDLSGSFELISCKSICVSPAEKAAWLEQIVTLLRAHKSYHLYIISESCTHDQSHFSMTYYENQAALFTSIKIREPIVIMLREANTLHSLGLFIDRFIARIPTSQRNRDDVIQRLEQAIERLRQKYRQAPDHQVAKPQTAIVSRGGSDHTHRVEGGRGNNSLS